MKKIVLSLLIALSLSAESKCLYYMNNITKEATKMRYVSERESNFEVNLYANSAARNIENAIIECDDKFTQEQKDGMETMRQKFIAKALLYK